MELLWVARTHKLDPETPGRQLPGIRAVKRWVDSDCRDLRFGMSQDQWERYRQTGVYGAYRVMLRRLPGLTLRGNGWTPAERAFELADVIECALEQRESLPRVAGKRISGHAGPETYWKSQWRTWDQKVSPAALTFLPQSRDQIAALPDKGERTLLEELIFGETSQGTRRRRVVTAAVRSSAEDHAQLCTDIVEALGSEPDREEMAMLPQFTLFADAALETLLEIWKRFSAEDASEPAIWLSETAANPSVQASVETLRLEAQQWLEARNKQACQNLPVLDCDELARQLAAGPGPSQIDMIRRLLQHHLHYGGGLRWMELHEERIIPKVPTRYEGASAYRFRLWQVCRLAVQCGVIETMPVALVRGENGSEEE